MQEPLERLNSLPSEEAVNEFLKCCGSKGWAGKLVEARPFASFAELTEKARQVWWNLGPDDWLEAFRSHPKIGEKKAEINSSAEAAKWSADEQSGTRDSAAHTMQALADLNREYDRKFGFIFIVCATGKTSEEMLALLRERLHHDRHQELKIAAAEQAKITELRLRKLVGK